MCGPRLGVHTVCPCTHLYPWVACAFLCLSSFTWTSGSPLCLLTQLDTSIHTPLCAPVSPTRARVTLCVSTAWRRVGVFTQVLTLPGTGPGVSSATPSPRTVPKARSTTPPPQSVPEKQKPAGMMGEGAELNLRVRSVLPWDHPHQVSPVLPLTTFITPTSIPDGQQRQTAYLCSQETLAQASSLPTSSPAIEALQK